MTTLTTTQLKLRAPEPADLDCLYKWENDTSVWHISSTSSPFSKQTLKNYLNSVQDIFTDRQLRLMIDKLDGTSIGCVDLYEFDPLHQRAGVGILIGDKSDRGKGYAKQALDLLISYCFNHLLLNQLYCTIPKDNNASIRLFKNARFIQCGTLKDWINFEGEFQDAHIYQLFKADFTG